MCLQVNDVVFLKGTNAFKDPRDLARHAHYKENLPNKLLLVAEVDTDFGVIRLKTPDGKPVLHPGNHGWMLPLEFFERPGGM